MSAPRDWFRSAEMEYVSLVIHEHCAHRVACDLGRLGIVMFTDLNPDLTPFQRRYAKEIQRCDEVERRLRYFEEMISKFSIVPRPAPDVKAFLDDLDRKIEGQSPIVVVDKLEVLVSEKEEELVNLTSLGATLAAEQNSKIELKSILEKIRVFGRQDDPNMPRNARNTTASGVEGGVVQERTMGFRFITGVVNKDDRSDFERVVFRTTRGNCFMRFTDMEEPFSEGIVTRGSMKEIFIIFFQASYIEEKLRKVCDSFNAKIYAVPSIENAQEIANLITETSSEIIEGERVIHRNRNDTIKLLKELALALEQWRWIVRREKSVYHTMNLFAPDVAGILRAEGWVIAKEKQLVVDTVSRVHATMTGDANRNLPSWTTTLPKSEWPSKAPTFFKTNKFTEVFQLIIDTYGIPRYQEANPALFAAVCFPFMFGVMFGDIGHGSLLFIFAFLVCLKEKSLGKQDLGELGSLLYNGRYLLLLNGFFATYAGFIYNDCFGMGLLLFNPTWSALPPGVNPETNQSTQYYVRDPPDSVYPFGVDPTWHVSENSLLFFNSFKMKMAVIIGVAQMSGGIILKGLNAIHYHTGHGPNLDLWFEAVPMFIFMQALFGYMCFMIFYKWGLSWAPDCGRQFNCDTPNCSCFNPPSLITTLINMVLQPGTVDLPLYENQGGIQVLLVLIAVFMVPLMLIPKPYILIQRLNHTHRALEENAQHGIGETHQQHGGSSYGAGAGAMSVREIHDPIVPSDTAGAAGASEEAGHATEKPHSDEEHGVGDIIIHQAIETIEFVLGCISNTASYLRLWALSLAHSQLSAVFLQRTVVSMLKVEGGMGPIGTWAACAVFFFVTFGVILCMDNLECFLHALRLVWVEFMNKFYKGEGLKFAPLDFNNVLRGIRN